MYSNARSWLQENIKKLIEEVHPKLIVTYLGELNAEYVRVAKQLNIKVITGEKHELLKNGAIF